MLYRGHQKRQEDCQVPTIKSTKTIIPPRSPNTPISQAPGADRPNQHMPRVSYLFPGNFTHALQTVMTHCDTICRRAAIPRPSPHRQLGSPNQISLGRNGDTILNRNSASVNMDRPTQTPQTPYTPPDRNCTRFMASERCSPYLPNRRPHPSRSIFIVTRATAL